jgi:uncharacterized protein YoxC
MDRQLDALTSEVRGLRQAIEALIAILSPEDGQTDPVQGLAESLQNIAQAVHRQADAVTSVDSRVSSLRDTLREHSHALV